VSRIACFEDGDLEDMSSSFEFFTKETNVL